MDQLVKWTAFLSGVAGLIAAIAALLKTDSLATIVGQIKNCRSEIVVTIDSPRAGDQTAGTVTVSGTSAVHPTCRYVFVIAQDLPETGRRWKVVDIPQLQNDGSWAGKARIDHVPVGSEVTIVAHVAGDARAYTPNQILSTAPDSGMPSNFVTIRRVQ